MEQIGFGYLTLFLWAISGIDGAMYLPKVECDKPLPATVPVDSPQHRYRPHFVRLYRCQGSINDLSPNVAGCVATAYTELTINVWSINQRKTSEVIVRNHTNCGPSCKANPTECRDKVQQWNGKTCSCDCLYDDRNPAPKKNGFRWNGQTCRYECSGIGACPEKKEWNMEECSCVCKKQYNNKCTLLGKIVDDATCECKDRTQYTRGPGPFPEVKGEVLRMRFQNTARFLGNSITIVLVALLVTALFVIGLLGVLLCSRCKSSSPSMKSAESQTSQIASSFSDDLPKVSCCYHESRLYESCV